jgi:soluble lytic murein transglycosylase-like protein
MLLGGLAALAVGSAQAGAYVVQPGDTLTAISQQTGVSIQQIVQANSLSDPNLIVAGQYLAIPQAHPAPEAVSGDSARRLLVAAAHEFGLNPNFVLAVSLWESGQNQAEVSSAGAIGLMQILPATARWAGPALLGGPVDINLARDNARVGAALLIRYLDDLNDDPRLALAAYYQGEHATQLYGVFPSSESYVAGIWALRNQLQAENGWI